MIELSELYEVDLIEILNGERKIMNQEEKQVMEKVSELTQEQEMKRIKKIHRLIWMGLSGLTVFSVCLFMGVESQEGWGDLLSGVGLGLAFGSFLALLLLTTKTGYKIFAFKRRLFESR